MKNVTVSILEELARWARLRAAEHDSGVSGLLSRLIQEKRESESRYQSSMDGFLSRLWREWSGRRLPRGVRTNPVRRSSVLSDTECVSPIRSRLCGSGLLSCRHMIFELIRLGK
jgi:hypothetical protein